jgi:hypothetical protein
MYFKQEEEVEWEEGKTDYSNAQLEQLADQMLREYAKRELCRECLEEGEEEEGQETGHIEHIPQFDKGEPVLDGEGNHLSLDFPEYTCTKGHTWFIGEGKSRTHSGKNPVLFEEHLIQRRKREIYTTEGVPDPNIVSGMYNRTHPQGRKVNTDKQRKSHGASFTDSWLVDELETVEAKLRDRNCHFLHHAALSPERVKELQKEINV